MNKTGLRRAEVARLIDAYELEVACAGCQRVVHRPIGFLRGRAQLRCPHCSAAITLEASKLYREIRHIGRQMRRLHSQLLPVVAAREQEIRKLLESPLPED